MARSLGCDPSKHFDLDDFDKDTSGKLAALNRFRCGQTATALAMLGDLARPADCAELCDIERRLANSSQFCGWPMFERNLAAMDDLAAFLEARGF